MNGEIVNRFYSNRERWGLKKHKASRKECDFLESISDTDQCYAFCEESHYNLKRVKLKHAAVKLLVICISGLGVFLIVTVEYIYFALALAGITITGVIAIQYKNKIETIKIENAIFRASKIFFIQKMFK